MPSKCTHRKTLVAVAHKFDTFEFGIYERNEGIEGVWALTSGRELFLGSKIDPKKYGISWGNNYEIRIEVNIPEKWIEFFINGRPYGRNTNLEFREEDLYFVVTSA